jgi:hypothetical protein
MENTRQHKTSFHIFEDQNISEREKYKYYTQNDNKIKEFKEKIRKIVANKGLSSVMNDTKWLKLQSSIVKLPFPPPYVEKLIEENKTFKEVQISDTPNWLGNWNTFYNEGMSLFFAIEYIKVRPIYSEYLGSLIDPKIYDEGEEFELLLKELNIPYEEHNKTFIIYGYK